MKHSHKAIIALAVLAYPIDLIARDPAQPPPEPIRLHAAYTPAMADYHAVHLWRIPEKLGDRQKAEAMVMLFSEPRP